MEQRQKEEVACAGRDADKADENLRTKKLG